MVDTIKTKQNLLYRYRSRTRGFRAPGSELFRTHYYAIPTSLIPTGVFERGGGKPSYRLSPVFFKTAVRITDAADYRGIIFSYGDGTSNVVLWANQGFNLQVGANEGVVDTNSSVLVHIPVGVANSRTFEIAVGIIPGINKVYLWIDGKVVVRNDTISGAYPNGVWTGNGNGSYAAAPQFVSTIVAAEARIAPLGFNVIDPLEMFMGQIPRHFI